MEINEKFTVNCASVRTVLSVHAGDINLLNWHIVIYVNKKFIDFNRDLNEFE